jgi:hypothetical protein
VTEIECSNPPDPCSWLIATGATDPSAKAEREVHGI